MSITIGIVSIILALYYASFTKSENKVEMEDNRFMLVASALFLIAAAICFK